MNESALEVKLQENQTGDASQFLGLYILSYCMYMLVSDLPILSRVGITEIKDMMQLHGGSRMEEKHNMCDAHVCGSIAMHSMEMNCQEQG